MSEYPENPLAKKKRITGSCIVARDSVYRDGVLVFHHQSSGWPEFFDLVYQYLDINYPRFHKMDGLSKLGLLASEVLLRGMNRIQELGPYQTGIVLANSNSSLDTDLKYAQTMEQIPSPALFVYTLPNIVIGEICIRNHFKGENAFFVFKAFDGTFMAQYVSNLLEGSGLDACLCGWVDLLESQYEAVLFMVEQGIDTQSPEFSAENLNQIYLSRHG
jgi:hypothetical protein